MLAEVSDNQYVCLKGKVVSMFPIQEVSIKSSGKKWTYIWQITQLCIGVVWEKQIKVIEDGKGYKLGNVTVRTFNGAKFISLGENCVVEEIEDIGNVVDEDPEGGVGRAKVVKADIVGIIGNVETYKSCRSCNGKVIETNALFGVCSKRNSKMKIARYSDHSVVNVMLPDENNKEYQVTMFNDIINQNFNAFN